MKKLLYAISLILSFGSINAQNANDLIFSWQGEINTAPNPDEVVVSLYVQNMGVVPVWLVGFNTRLYYDTANILNPGQSLGANPIWTFSTEASDGGFINLSNQHQFVAATVYQGNLVNRYHGIAPFVDVSSFDGLFLPVDGSLQGIGESSTSAPILIGTFRLRIQAALGGSGCMVTPPFVAAMTYTASEVQPTIGGEASGLCANGCTLEFEGQGLIPEQGNACCALCGLLSESPLPLDLVKFTADKYQRTSAQLYWQTANEENVNRFEIERSIDAVSWELVGKAAAHGSQALNSYSTLDKDVYDGRAPRLFVYYRLKIIDNDGAFTYSNIETVRFFNESDAFSAYIYPNPSVEGVSIEFHYGAVSTPVTEFHIYNNLGQMVYSQEVAAGAEAVYLNHQTAGLVAGSYVIRLLDVNSNLLAQDKIVVQR